MVVAPVRGRTPLLDLHDEGVIVNLSRRTLLGATAFAAPPRPATST